MTRPTVRIGGALQGGGGGYILPQEPDATGALVHWKMQEAANTSTVLADASGSLNPTIVARTLTATRSPIQGQKLAALNGATHAAAPLNGIGAGIEKSLECILRVNSSLPGDSVATFATTGYASPSFGFRVAVDGTVQIIVSGGWSVLTNNRINNELWNYIGLYRRADPAVLGKVFDEFWCNGVKLHTSASNTPSASGAGHTLTMSSGGWEKAHMIFWDSYRTDAQKKENAEKVLPWLVAA
jgi:hypothetical protein